jgi:hypothetical protein
MNYTVVVRSVNNCCAGTAKMPCAFRTAQAKISPNKAKGDGEMWRLVVCAITTGLTGCASPSTNMRVGGEQTYVSLQGQRDAALSVAQSQSVPSGAVAMGPVDASRCHRYQGDIEPSEEQLIADVKAAAYARGADGVAEVTIVKESGLLRNCWYIYTARATMYRKAQQ